MPSSTSSSSSPSALAPELFTAATRAWLARRFPGPTPVQARGWPLLAEGRHALLIAPTGSGKTLAAFLTAIDRLGRRAPDAAPGVRVLYVSPLKALVADVERNLRAPIAGIAEQAEEGAFRAPRVAIRTGDTSPRERRLQRRDPAEILVTTPESLYLLLGSQARATLATVETIIVDEIHALAGTKRGAHLALSLERVARRCRGGDPQRIGLSATARPPAAIARFLGGDREVEIVDASAAPDIDLTICVPVPDMTRPELVAAGAPNEASLDPAATPSPGLWPAIHPEILARIRAHRSSIVFTNSRALCERLTRALNELAGEPLVRAHHGSLAQEKRREIEQALVAGELRGIVATSSLELGIDMATVELVMLVESPGAVARGLQRIGRAGHAVGETSRGVLFPKHRHDLLEAAVVARGMRAGEVESITPPIDALDVLAQQIVAIVAEEPIGVDALAALVARSASHATLDRKLFESVLDMLSGRYPSTDFAGLRPRLHWDRKTSQLTIREGASRIAILSGGTIPDRGLYAVHIAPDGPRIGELDEEMVHESKPGDVVTLGASSWRILEITRDRVLVAPAPGEAGRLPFWRGDGPGRPIELGRALGRFVREALASGDPEAWLRAEGQLDAYAIRNLVAHLGDQKAATGVVPSDREIVVERFRDELGDWRVAILSPFGARVHAPWALAIGRRLAAWGIENAHPLWTDDGILFRFADADEAPPAELFQPDPEAVFDLVCEALESSSLFAAQFRENAARALLLPRFRAGARAPLWAQRLRAQSLHAVARQHPDFPILLETYRSCLQDVFDLPSLVELLRGLEAKTIRLHDVETRTPSPFARSLVFAYTASFLYQPDLPAAERRSQALALDRAQLRELLGGVALRSLLEPAALDDVEALLQGLAPERRAGNADALHDRLRAVGDLMEAELAARHGANDPRADAFRSDLDALRDAGRILPIVLPGLAAAAGEAAETDASATVADPRWIAVEDAALYRDALGASLPAGLPVAFLAPATSPLEQLVMRFARTHAPFTTASIAAHFDLRPEALEPLLDSLARRGRLLAGEFDPRRELREWCEPEVLRRAKRETLRRLREEIEPVAGDVFARFLLDWHGIASPRRGDAALIAAVDRLEGLPLSFVELERSILPARIADFEPALLDRAGSEGRIGWIGAGALGAKDGRIALHRRERLPRAMEAREATAADEAGTALSPAALRLREVLAARGASFFSELLGACAGFSARALEEALFELVWRGEVGNDTFAPLRARRRARVAPTSRARRPGRHAPPSATAGRWSLVAAPPSHDAATASPDPSRSARDAVERLHARTLILLDRHGIVSRESLEAESDGEPGGFAAILPVLRELEEAGRIRRGHFRQGGTSAQFALPGVADRLRAFRARPASPQAVLLASSDPAQPYGAQLDWPAPRAGRPRRAVGTAVVLVDGRPELFVERGGRSLLTFASEAPPVPTRECVVALEALVAQMDRLGVKRLSVEEVDGLPARTSILADALREVGFREGYRGFELERRRR